jgi:hypothetical protein
MREAHVRFPRFPGFALGSGLPFEDIADFCIYMLIMVVVMMTITVMIKDLLLLVLLLFSRQLLEVSANIHENSRVKKVQASRSHRCRISSKIADTCSAELESRNSV